MDRCLDCNTSLDEETIRCPTCWVIRRVIQALEKLVSYFPWLQTEGLAGAEGREEWELDGLIKKPKVHVQSESDSGGSSNASGREGVKAFRQKMLEDFYKTAGQGMTEEEALGEEASKKTQ